MPEYIAAGGRCGGGIGGRGETEQQQCGYGRERRSRGRVGGGRGKTGKRQVARAGGDPTPTRAPAHVWAVTESDLVVKASAPLDS